MTSQEYADLLIAESKKPESERQFTIANVPVKMRGEVGHLLRKAYGGNESDRKLGQAVQVVATAIPSTAAGMMIAPYAVSAAVNPAVRKYIIDAITGYLGGNIVDELTKDASGGKYESFGNYVYDASGLSNVSKGTPVEEIVKTVSDMTNPGYYMSAIAKPVINVATAITSKIQPGAVAIKHKYARENVRDGIKDVLNYINTDRTTEPKFFNEVRRSGDKQAVRNATAYVTNEGTLLDFPDQTVYKNASNTAAITKLDDHTYSVRLSPEHGKTLSLKDRKEVLN